MMYTNVSVSKSIMAFGPYDIDLMNKWIFMPTIISTKIKIIICYN